MNKKNTSLIEAIQEAIGQKPNKVDAQNAQRTQFHRKQLSLILKGLFEIKCPEHWSTDYMLDLLLFEGKFSIQDTSMGVVPLRCQPHGINVFERPTDITIANPVLGTFDRKIDVNATIIYAFDDKYFRTFNEIIDIYAAKLALCDSAIDVNLLNSKVAHVFDCADKKQAEEAKLIYDKISRGEPAVFYSDSSGLDGGKKLNMFKLDVKNSFVADIIQDQKNAIKNEFLTMIGVNNSNTDKKERLIVDEVNANNDELKVDITYVYNNIKKQVKKANAMFPDINLSIKMPTLDNLTRSSTAEQKKEGSDREDEPSGFNGNMGTSK